MMSFSRAVETVRDALGASADDGRQDTEALSALDEILAGIASTAAAMRLWAESVRGDWSSLDGRDVAHTVEVFAASLSGDRGSGWGLCDWRSFLGLDPEGGDGS